MKDILKSLKDNATSRLNNPVVGAFVLAWCALNINGLATFLLSDNARKLEIVANKHWSVFEDVAIPLVISFTYLVLLPVLNLAYEYVSDGVINSMRDKQKNTHDTAKFLRLKSTVAAKVEADEEFIRKLKDQQIEGWLEQQSMRNKEFIQLKDRYSSLLVQLNERDQTLAVSRAQWSSDMKKMKDSNDLVEADSVSKLTYLESTLEEFSKILNSNDNQLVEHDIKELRSKVSEIRFKFEIMDWDDDIPF
ncbi:hypothetical protein [Vibrio splendidus]|uniref:hypothetical protein n=1 Tax=Vibrio splendidus TaxID=29497 RepID=UPI0006CA41F9|nr:hypothetical protein [Vibrio splendidus]KPL98287.1 hypothetical protein AN167_18885 [Vibrio splendidus]